GTDRSVDVAPRNRHSCRSADPAKREPAPSTTAAKSRGTTILSLAHGDATGMSIRAIDPAVDPKEIGECALAACVHTNARIDVASPAVAAPIGARPRAREHPCRR